MAGRTTASATSRIKAWIVAMATRCNTARSNTAPAVPGGGR